MPRMKSNELKQYLGAGYAKNAGGAHSKRPKFEKLRAEHVDFHKKGDNRGELGRKWDDTFGKDE
jgi:hypothetical protein